MKTKEEEKTSKSKENKGKKKDLEEIAILKEKVKNQEDKYLRLYSEFENYRKRTQNEKLELYKTASEEIIKDLLPLLDDLERAKENNKKNNDTDSIKEGVNLILDKFQKILNQSGLKEIDKVINSEFDINKHEAISQIQVKDKSKLNKVIDQVEKGYELNGKLIRFSKVVVGK